jgi:acyl-coenzyme A thioesterase PaaI-like protein
LTVRGTLLHRTATLAFTQSTIYDAKGRACATAMGTFKYLKDPARSAALLQRSASNQ